MKFLKNKRVKWGWGSPYRQLGVKSRPYWKPCECWKIGIVSYIFGFTTLIVGLAIYELFKHIL